MTVKHKKIKVEQDILNYKIMAVNKNDFGTKPVKIVLAKWMWLNQGFAYCICWTLKFTNWTFYWETKYWNLDTNHFICSNNSKEHNVEVHICFWVPRENKNKRISMHTTIWGRPRWTIILLHAKVGRVSWCRSSHNSLWILIKKMFKEGEKENLQDDPSL